ncbi:MULTISPECIES: hypothetical protein [Oleiagrimonas]|uniref:EF-hand domain-containing protein n=1 Tax=Oleiagrimonas citrea TaxID=1665687 RepID=A0A846ZP02_9GAMM|nr:MULTISPECIES: hypothetical protein [Oleiagrimonas]NKZ39934.1 hypothetical protein [Oleiagrimonas citrea]
MAMERISIIVAAALGVLAFSTTAVRSAPVLDSAGTSRSEHATPPSFSQLDRNHDGRLMRSEVPHDMHRLRRHFRQYDRDGNGSLSKHEYNAFAHPKVYRKIE